MISKQQYLDDLAARKTMAYGKLLTKMRRGVITLEEMHLQCSAIEGAYQMVYTTFKKLCADEKVFTDVSDSISPSKHFYSKDDVELQGWLEDVRAHVMGFNTTKST